MKTIDGNREVSYYDTGQVQHESWWYCGKLHRLDGPAVINYDPDGHVRSQQWYRYGLLHREDGPALTLYDKERVSNRLCKWWLS